MEAPKDMDDMMAISFKAKTQLTELEIKKLDEIFDVLNKDTEHQIRNARSPLCICSGVAGIGKTTAMKQLVWLWINNRSEPMKRYKAVFYIPVKKVQKNEIMSILSKELRQLPESEKKKMHHYLLKPENARRVCFIVDGIDEVEIRETSELHRLMAGKFYQGATVLVCVRHDDKYMKTLHLKPKVLVTFHGTNQQTVQKCVEGAIQDAGEDVKQFVAHNLPVQEKLLHVPLYLMLTCLIFRYNISQDPKGTKTLRIPKTSTNLFNCYMRVSINRWLGKMKRKEKVLFEKTPLEEESKVPTDIKRTLYFLGKMCYEGLLKNESSFKMSDLNKFLLNECDVHNCGLFCVSESDPSIVYAEHEQFQEYLAGLYLAHEPLARNALLIQLRDKHLQRKTLGQFFGERHILKAVQFSCGLSADFYDMLFTEALNSQLGLAKSQFSRSLDLYYEAMLHTEQKGSGGVSLKMEQYITSRTSECFNRKTVNTIQSSMLTQWHLKNLVAGLKLKSMLLLLKNAYKVPLRQNARNILSLYFGETEPHSAKLSLALDQLQAELLSRFVIIDVSHMTISHIDAAYVDLPSLSRTLPHLKILDITCDKYISYQCNNSVDNNTSQQTESVSSDLQHITLRSQREGVTLQETQVQWLLQQQRLESIHLYQVFIFTANIQTLASQLNIKDLSITLGNLSANEIHGICSVLSRSSASLCSLLLNFQMADAGSLIPLSAALRNVKKLQRLNVCLSPQNEELTANLLEQTLPDLSQLKTLCITEVDIRFSAEKITNAVCKCGSISVVNIYHSLGIQALPEKCKEQLTQRDIDVQLIRSLERY